MEGDAGTGQLNPINEDPISTEVTGEATDEATAASEAGAEPSSTEAVDDSAGDPAGDPAGEDSDDSTGADSEESDAEESGESEPAESADPGPQRPPSRLSSRAWVVGIAAILVVLAGALGAAGYFALLASNDRQAIARNNASALQLAKDCVAATQAPDTGSMAASEQKIIDCGTDQYRTQALLYSSMLVQAYQAANVHLKVSDLRAAIERDNPDGSIDVLVALRVNLSNDQQQNTETGYRLRVKMAPADGTYKISKLDQVTK